jgi:hypothetical protein
MNFQRAPTSIVRSIRQVSLVKDWLQMRRHYALPNIGEYVPDARSDDAADSVICEVLATDQGPRYRCFQAGRRVEQANDAPMQGLFLDECFTPAIVASAQSAWNAAITYRLPIYAIAPATDRDGCPVTLEHLYLPFSGDHSTPGYMLGSFHAFSTEGRFQNQGLLRVAPKVPRQWAVIIDPGFGATLTPLVQDAPMQNTMTPDLVIL